MVKFLAKNPSEKSCSGSYALLYQQAYICMQHTLAVHSTQHTTGPADVVKDLVHSAACFCMLGPGS